MRNVVVPARTKQLGIDGANLLALGGEPQVRLNGQPVAIRELDDDRIVLESAQGFESGALEVLLPDGETVEYELSVEPESENEADEFGFEEWAPAETWRNGGQ